MIHNTYPDWFQFFFGFGYKGLTLLSFVVILTVILWLVSKLLDRLYASEKPPELVEEQLNKKINVKRLDKFVLYDKDGNIKQHRF